MANHNGSIWPHDNVIIAMGMSRYGLAQGAEQLLGGLFDLSIYVDLHRLPELICGFLRKPGEGPILYPVACAPQAWAAGGVFFTVTGLSRHFLSRWPNEKSDSLIPLFPSFTGYPN